MNFSPIIDARPEPTSFIERIRNCPTTVTSIPMNCIGVHESTLRSSRLLDRVKLMLERNDSRETILEVIQECEK